MAGGNGRSILSKEYVIEILLHLQNYDSVICTDLSCIVKSGTTRKNTLIQMKDADLVYIKKIDRPRLTYSISLTPKGSVVAGYIKLANEKLENEATETEEYRAPSDEIPAGGGARARPDTLKNAKMFERGGGSDLP